MAIREIGTSITLDNTQFKKEMSAVNSNLSGLQSEMKAVTAEFADNAKSVDALTAKQKILDQQEAQQRVKVDALTKAYEEQAAATGENSVETDALRKQLNNAKAELFKTEKASRDNTKALQEAEKATGLYAAAVVAGQAALKGLELAGKGAVGTVKLTGKALEGAAKAAAALTTAGLAATGAVAGLAVSGLKTLSEWAVEAAKEVDADGNVINSKFAGLAENLASVEAGTKSAKQALAGALLPALEGLTGKGGKLLSDFTSALEGAEGDTSKMGEIVAEYLGKAVEIIREELPEILRLGGDLLSGLVEGAVEELPEILSLAEEILTTLLDGVQQNLPMLSDAAVQIVMSLLEFLISNAPQLLTSGITMVTTLISGLSSAAPQLVPAAAQLVVQLLSALIQNAPEMLKAGLELVLGIVQGLIAAIPELVAAIPQLIEDFKKGFSEKMGDIQDIGKQIIDNVLAGLKAAWEAVKKWFNNAVGGLSGNATVGIETKGSKAAGGLNYIPYDNFPATLHRGERVLTAAENAAYNSGGSGGGGKIVNLTVYAQELTETQVDYLIRRVNEDLGEDV